VNQAQLPALHGLVSRAKRLKKLRVLDRDEAVLKKP
jgi:hypothetical protein